MVVNATVNRKVPAAADGAGGEAAGGGGTKVAQLAGQRHLAGGEVGGDAGQCGGVQGRARPLQGGR